MIQFDQNIIAKCRADMTHEQALHIYKTKAKHREEWSKNTHNVHIKLSVIIPFFRSGHIAWLALESLIRQRNINFDWELIIMEENFDNPFGPTKVFFYKEQLKKVGCVRIKYISISEWLPLSAKWYFLINNINIKSKIVAFNSADVYCGKDRLKKQYDILSEGKYNWYKLSGNLVYDILLNKHVKRVSIEKTKPDTACRALTSDLAKKLPLACVMTSVDGWTYNTLDRKGIQFYYDESNLWHDTINVNGINNISHGRRKRILNVIPPLSCCCDSLKNHIPNGVVKKLQQTRKHVENHKTLLDNSKIKFKSK